MVADTLIPGLRRQRQRQVEFCDFNTSLFYVEYRSGRATKRDPISKPALAGYLEESIMGNRDTE